jgi:hypothetical protein
VAWEGCAWGCSVVGSCFASGVLVVVLRVLAFPCFLIGLSALTQSASNPTNEQEPKEKSAGLNKEPSASQKKRKP